MKYIIFSEGVKQDENQLKCPNCHSGKNKLKGNNIDKIYTCKKCGCRFGVGNEFIKKENKSIKIYNLDK